MKQSDLDTIDEGVTFAGLIRRLVLPSRHTFAHVTFTDAVSLAVSTVCVTFCVGEAVR